MKYTLHPVSLPAPPNLTITSGPRWNTTVFEDGIGNSQPQANWSECLFRFNLQFRRYSDDWDELLGFYMARKGPKYGFWFTDPMDNKDNGRGKIKYIGDDFYLVKEYPDNFSPYNRIITGAQNLEVPEGESFYFYEQGTGRVYGVEYEIPAYFDFQVPVAFTSDVLELQRNAAIGDWAGVILDEIRNFSVNGGGAS